MAGYVMTVYLPEGSHTHPSTNRARCKATALIETNALPLHQTANQTVVNTNSKRFSIPRNSSSSVRVVGSEEVTTQHRQATAERAGVVRPRPSTTIVLRASPLSLRQIGSRVVCRQRNARLNLLSDLSYSSVFIVSSFSLINCTGFSHLLP